MLFFFLTCDTEINYLACLPACLSVCLAVIGSRYSRLFQSFPMDSSGYQYRDKSFSLCELFVLSVNCNIVILFVYLTNLCMSTRTFNNCYNKIPNSVSRRSTVKSVDDLLLCVRSLPIEFTAESIQQVMVLCLKYRLTIRLDWGMKEKPSF